MDVGSATEDRVYTLPGGGLASIDADSGNVVFTRFSFPAPVFYGIFVQQSAGIEIAIDDGFNAHVSPDGSTLAYVTPACPQPGERTGLYVVDLAEPSRQRLLVEGGDIDGSLRFWWLSDGRILVRDTQAADPTSAYRVVDPATGSELTDEDAFGTAVSATRYLALSPDLRFALFEDQGGLLMLQDLATGEVQQFEAPAAGPVSASWAPDSRHVAYWTEGAVMVIGTDGTSMRVNVRDAFGLAADVEEPNYPALAWAPHNETLAISLHLVAGLGVCH